MIHFLVTYLLIFIHLLSGYFVQIGQLKEVSIARHYDGETFVERDVLAYWVTGG